MVVKAQTRVTNVPRVSLAPMSTFGVGGAVVYGGHVHSYEKDSRLTGSTRWKTISDMLANVSVVALGVRHFLNLAAKCDWTFQPKNETKAAKDVADFVTNVFADLEVPFHNVVRSASMYRFHGFSIHEWTAARRPDGRIGLKSIDSRPQSTIEQWDIDPTGVVYGVVQRDPNGGDSIYLPRSKLLYLVEDSLADSPEGLGIFRHLVEPTARLQRYEMLEGFGFETDLRGVPIARAPLSEMAAQIEAKTITEAQRDALLAPMRDFISGHIRTPALGLLLDSMTYQTVDESQSPSNVPLWSMELLKGTSTSFQDVARAIERLNLTMARLLGIEHLLMGGDGKGSLALSEDKTTTFALLVDSALKEEKERVKRDIVRQILKLNGISFDLMPEIEIETVQARKITDITAALRDMAQAGAMLHPEDPVMDEIRRLLGLRSKTKVLDVSAVPDPNPRQAAPQKEGA